MNYKGHIVSADVLNCQFESKDIVFCIFQVEFHNWNHNLPTAWKWNNIEGVTIFQSSM